MNKWYILTVYKEDVNVEKPIVDFLSAEGPKEAVKGFFTLRNFKDVKIDKVKQKEISKDFMESFFKERKDNEFLITVSLRNASLSTPTHFYIVTLK